MTHPTDGPAAARMAPSMARAMRIPLALRTAPATARRRASWPLLALALVGSLLAATGAPARADGDKRLLPASPPAAWMQECASCHVAYPPALLPADSWRRLMSTLPKHFGTDASLDAATTRGLSDWLQREAGTGRRVSPAPPEDRITRGAWFVREHREVSPASWRLPAVKSAANCAACHTRADQGHYDEHDIRIPR